MSKCSPSHSCRTSSSEEANGAVVKPLSPSKEKSLIGSGVRRIWSRWPPGHTITSNIRFADESARSDCRWRLLDVINWGRTSLVYKACRVVDGANLHPDKHFALKFMWIREPLEKQSGHLSPQPLCMKICKSEPALSLPQRGPGGIHKDDLSPRIELEAAVHLEASSVPHVSKIHEIVSLRSHVVFALDYYPGSLRRLACESEGLAPGMITVWLRQVLEALMALHEFDSLSAIVHGDVKADNILVNEKAEAVLVDFGASHRVPPVEAFGCREEGVFFGGSMSHCPPESLDYVREMYLSGSRMSTGGRASLLLDDVSVADKYPKQTSTDMWCLGLFSLELLTGETPFDALSGGDIHGDAISRVLDIVTDVEYVECLLSELLERKVPAQMISFIRQCLVPIVSERPTARILMEHPLISDNYAKQHPRLSQLKQAYEAVDARLYTVKGLTGSLAQRVKSPHDIGVEVYKAAAARYWDKKRCLSELNNSQPLVKSADRSLPATGAQKLIAPLQAIPNVLAGLAKKSQAGILQAFRRSATEVQSKPVEYPSPASGRSVEKSSSALGVRSPVEPPSVQRYEQDWCDETFSPPLCEKNEDSSSSCKGPCWLVRNRPDGAPATPTRGFGDVWNLFQPARLADGLMTFGLSRSQTITEDREQNDCGSDERDGDERIVPDVKQGSDAPGQSTPSAERRSHESLFKSQPIAAITEESYSDLVSDAVGGNVELSKSSPAIPFESSSRPREGTIINNLASAYILEPLASFRSKIVGHKSFEEKSRDQSPQQISRGPEIQGLVNATIDESDIDLYVSTP